ncbi:MAG: GNAT family N-acetyltransferase [Enterobacteriaceae bacterium]
MATTHENLFQLRPINSVKESKQVVDIWYRASILTHYFIDQNFWFSMKSEMESKYIPATETIVALSQQRIIGFISLRDHCIEALFIDPSFQGKGAGSQLLAYAQKTRDSLQLKVYEKNQQAFCFYLNKGFVVQKRGIDSLTGEPELEMILVSPEII